LFGLVPHWAKDIKSVKNTQLMHVQKPRLTSPVSGMHGENQHCSHPSRAIYEADWRSGKTTPTRITTSNGSPLGIIADLWSTAATVSARF
jgi:hypothetical protein